MNQVQYNALTRLGYSGSLNDMLLKFYRYYVNGNESLPDTEHKFLSQRGFTTGTLNDRWYAFLKTFGYTGSLTEMMYKWWTLDATMPMSLFMNGEQGWVYDPSNLSTLFQDSAGTTPVTAMEQPVGLQLDTRLGAPTTMGAELVTNGDFSSGATGWSTGAYWSISSGKLNLSAADSTASYADNTQLYSGVTTGKVYKVEFDVIDAGTGTINVSLRGGSTDVSVSSAGRKTLYQTAGASTAGYGIRFGRFAAGSCSIDNISVRELPGNHRYQTTSANRPVVSARVNLLTKTEQFDDAAWTKNNVSVTANAIVAPDGTTTADKIVAANITSEHSVGQVISTLSGAMTFSCAMKQGEWRYGFLRTKDSGGTYRNVIFDLANGAAVLTDTGWSNVSSTPLGNGWYLCYGTITIPVATNFATVGATNSSSTVSVAGDNTSGIYIWGADLRAANIGVGLPAYQRVNTSTDYDTAGFPVYIKPNGSNQFMVTNSINFSATDKMTVWQGVRKLSDAAVGIIAEMSTSAGGGTSGTFVLHTQTSPVGYRYAAGSGVSGTAFATDDVSVFTSPLTNVITGISNFSGSALADEISVRVNGVTPTQSLGGTVSTGNFGNYPAYFYMRGGSSLPFGGHDYGSICRGAASTAGEITSAETWINNRTKAF